MDKKTCWIIVGIVAVFALMVGISMSQSQGTIDYTAVIPADASSGNISELINGNPDAPVKIIEYGDYQCTACAPMNPIINSLIEEYDGKVAVVFRTLILDYHQNGNQAAAAALAANEQGYWVEFKDILFENQDDWYYSDTDTFQSQLEEYFMEVSDGQGNLAKFRTDQNSEAVQKKISHDNTIATNQKVEWTPYFMIGGELISQRDVSTEEFLNKMRTKIDAILATSEAN